MGMQTCSPTAHDSEPTVKIIRDLIHAEPFCHRHRAAKTNFTRQRHLTFGNVIVLLIQRTKRSIQLHLHDFFAALTPASSAVNASSWCEARLKLRHTAFLELNERAILDVVYEGKSDFEVCRWKGHRLLGIDSSLIRLPSQTGLGEEFGWVECNNQQGSSGR